MKTKSVKNVAGWAPTLRKIVGCIAGIPRGIISSVRTVIIFVSFSVLLAGYAFVVTGIWRLLKKDVGAHLKSRSTMCRMMLWILSKVCNVTYKVVGTPPTEPCVLMSTHQSTGDCPVIDVFCPNAVFVSKNTLKPFFGFAKGICYIDRSAPTSLISIMRNAKSAIECGHNFLIFAEGTRKKAHDPISIMPSVSCLYSKNIANKIVPIYVKTGHISPKKSDLVVVPGEVIIEFLSPIEVDPEKMSAKAFVSHIEKMLEETRLKYDSLE